MEFLTMKNIKLTHDECYQMTKLYDLIRDMDLELHSLCDNVFIKIMEGEVMQCISNNKDNATYNEADYVEQCIIEGHDYRDCVDTLVDNMKSTK